MTIWAYKDTPEDRARIRGKRALAEGARNGSAISKSTWFEKIKEHGAMSQPTTSGVWVRGIYETLDAAGLDPRPLFKQARIHLVGGENGASRISTDRISHLWELAAAQSGNPAIGVVMPHLPMPHVFDVVGYAMMASENLLASAERLVRYQRIISDAATLRLDASEDRTSYRIALELVGRARPVPRQRFEFDLLALLKYFRWISGKKLRPNTLELAFPRPTSLRAYESAFECKLRFGAPINCLIFEREDLIAPLRTSSPTLAQLHDTFASNLLTQFDSVSTRQKVRGVIARTLRDGTPFRRDIAKTLGISERTLQRRLNEENVSFQGLLDDIRQELAAEYLANDRLSLSEIAHLLGFADRSNFFRSCKRWFTWPPSEFRRQMKGLD